MLNSLSPASIYLRLKDPELYRTAQGKLSLREGMTKRVSHAGAAFLNVAAISGLSCLFFGSIRLIPYLPRVFSTPTTGAGPLIIPFTMIAVPVFSHMGIVEKVDNTISHLQGIWDPRIVAQQKCDKMISQASTFTKQCLLYTASAVAIYASGYLITDYVLCKAKGALGF